MQAFDYEKAFSRNLGWVSRSEQATLRNKRVAIGGLGGVGGIHLLTLARLGIGRFTIADFDVFELANFNRQSGATVSTLARPKSAVLAEMVCDINPEIELRNFPGGIQPETIDAFLEGVDVYVDGLDFFAFGARRMTLAACERKGIPVVTAGPLGMGAALIVFAPGGMPFEDYFGFEGCDENEMAIRFLVGLSPTMLHRSYVADMAHINFAEHRVPSTAAACRLCAGIVSIETLKLLLGRGEVRLAPRASQFDGYRMRYARTWRPGGHRNPLQRLMFAFVKAHLARQSRKSGR